MTGTMMKRVGAAVAAVAASFALGLGTAGVADAKIHEEPISCTNPAGNLPGGQQPSCQNDTLTQESENQNPAGHAPGGHNK
ncbi:hypothetical protein ABZO31_15210 [Streptomyces sp. HUAS MG47]|uniref:hypothetical protein n=1 Tax=Streptomyces solicamelliae TaxID=3231716 RepID=UPI0038778F19